MSRKKDTITSLAAIIAHERYNAAKAKSDNDEETSFGFKGNIDDFMHEAIKFVLRCKKSDW